MEIIKTFGNYVEKWCENTPDRARWLLTKGWEAQDLKFRLAPSKKMNPSDQYLARMMMNVMLQPLKHPDQSVLVSVFTPCELMQEAGLYPYNVDSYYSEESTEFYPSQDTKKYLIYNECYINKKDQVIPAKENENLNSILIDFEKDEVKYLKGNQFENLKKENNISEKYLAKQGKASLQLEKYADKEGYIIGESTKYKGQVLCIMKKVKEESILKNKIFEQRNGKIKCIFEFI